MPAFLHFDAVVSPHRSLSRRGFRILIGVLAAVNLVMAGVFVLIGAFPIPIFLGVDVLGVYLAFQASYRSGRQLERVQVSADSVRVLYEAGRMAREVWRSPTAFTRVEVERDQDDALLRLAVSDRSRLIGRALSPAERVDLGQALERAIGEARRERHGA